MGKIAPSSLFKAKNIIGTPKLVEALREYSQKLEIVVESFTEADIALSEIMAPKE